MIMITMKMIMMKILTAVTIKLMYIIILIAYENSILTVSKFACMYVNKVSLSIIMRLIKYGRSLRIKFFII